MKRFASHIALVLLASTVVVAQGLPPLTGGGEANPGIDCDGDYQALSFDSDTGEWSCGADEFNSGATVTKLGANVTAADPAAYSTVFSITPTASKNHLLFAFFIWSTSTTGVAPQFRMLTDDANQTGSCSWVMPSSASGVTWDTISVLGGADTANTTEALGTGLVQPALAWCTFVATATPVAVQIQVQPEVAGTITVYAGSYYTLVTN